MVQKIEKISKVNGVSYDVNQPFEERHGFTDRDGGQRAFRSALTGAMRKRQQKSSEPIKIADPYRLDLQRATQSLFYEGRVNPDILRKLGNEV